VTPYYSHDGITLYHGDCLEVGAWLAGDVLVTDPPYGIGWSLHGENRNARSYGHPGIQGDGDVAARDAVLARWAPRPAVVFGSFRSDAPADLRQTLTWRKPADAGVIGSTTGYRTDTELVYLLGTWPRRVAAWSSVLETNGGMHAYLNGHPHAKPVGLLETLIRRAPAGVIVDPFAGSGSTLVAAKLLGRAAIGVEIEERYCEMAARRLDQGVLAFG
jgi:site-specific DNA-methyltransferase (adenine-specific)